MEDYLEPKLEAFYSGVRGENHYSIRTCVPATKGYWVTKGNNKLMGYTLAMQGIYVPIVDLDSGKVIFTRDMYDKIREEMIGLSQYKTEAFKVDETAYTEETSKLVKELYPNKESNISKSQIEAQKIRNAILDVVRKTLAENMRTNCMCRTATEFKGRNCRIY